MEWGLKIEYNFFSENQLSNVGLNTTVSDSLEFKVTVKLPFLKQGYTMPYLVYDVTTQSSWLQNQANEKLGSPYYKGRYLSYAQYSGFGRLKDIVPKVLIFFKNM